MPHRLMLTLSLLTACASFPEVDAAGSGLPAAAHPTSLMPADVLAASAASTTDAFSEGNATAARAARLKARGDALRAR